MQIVDLTVLVREGMTNLPSHGRGPVFLPGTLSHQNSPSGKPNPYDGRLVTYANELIVMCGHTGTHMDAGTHANPKSEYPIDRIALDRGYGTAVWFDVSAYTAPKAVYTPSHLEAAERSAGIKVEAGDIVLLHTGWSLLRDTEPDRFMFERPGLGREAAEWLRERRIRTLGVDTVSPESLVTAPEAIVHTNFLCPEAIGLPPTDYIAIIENLANVDRIGAHRFTFAGLPLPLEAQTGSPLRAVAVLA